MKRNLLLGFVFIMSALLFVPRNINAEEMGNDFKKILNVDGDLVVTDTSLASKRELIVEFVSKYNTANSFYHIDDCSTENNCTISFYKDNVLIETHNLDVKYEEKYSEEFKKLTNGNMVIPYTSVWEDSGIIWTYVSNFNTKNINFSVSRCNDDRTVCTIAMSDDRSYYSTVEQHVVDVSYKEKYSEEFKSVLKDGKLVVKSVKPTNLSEAEFFIANYVSSLSHDNYEYINGQCNDEYTVCDLYLYTQISEDLYTNEIHKVVPTYDKVDEKIEKQVNKILDSLPETKRFVVEDLEMVNYIVNAGYSLDDFSIEAENAIINYSSDLKKFLGNGNITAKLDSRAGSGGIFSSMNFGGFIVLYDDVAYGLMDGGGAVKKHVIYVPDTTEETKEAYMKAAQERINKYLKNDKVKITYAGKISELEDTDHEEVVGTKKIRDEYYTLSYNGNEFPFLIVKDSSKMKDGLSHSTNDIMTNVSISTNSAQVPLDTSIKVKPITKENKEYNEIIKKLDVEDAIIYDLKLYSNVKGDYINKLDDDTFMVSIPLPENMKNKDFIAYYINDNGKIEDYKVKVVKGFATFETNHFSTYTLAPIESEEVPNTIDNIGNYIIVFIISLIGISIVYINRKKFN